MVSPMVEHNSDLAGLFVRQVLPGKFDFEVGQIFNQQRAIQDADLDIRVHFAQNGSLKGLKIDGISEKVMETLEDILKSELRTIGEQYKETDSVELKEESFPGYLRKA